MKGILKKTKEGWFVEYKVEERTPVGHKSWWETIPIHQETFDPNIKQPIVTLVDGKEVEFEIVNMGYGYDDNILQYAKL
jgi:hypothetical protein